MQSIISFPWNQTEYQIDRQCEWPLGHLLPVSTLCSSSSVYRGVRSWVVYLWAFLGIGLSIGAWSLAAPSSGQHPISRAQMLQGVAIVRGHFDGRQVPLASAGIQVGRIGLIEVPAWAKDVPNLTDEPNTATCSQRSCDLVTSVPSHSPTVLTGTQFSDYPPLYYLIVGWPTLFTTGHTALYGERIASVLLNSALIALGLFLLARYHHRQLLVGALVAMAPMVLFISAVVSSSGTETAAGFARVVWGTLHGVGLQ